MAAGVGELALSEKAMLARCEARAAELGQPLRLLLKAVGLGHDTLSKDVQTRQVSTLERVAAALHWTLADVLGFPSGIDVAILARALDTAETVVAGLPRVLQTHERRVLAIAHFYDLIAARQREGEPVSNETIRNWSDSLALAWRQGKPGGGRATE
jgi:hypothetical protein